METFIRWKSEKFGSVSPEKTIRAISKLGLFNELNEWIFHNVAEDIAKMGKVNKRFPVVHINCPKSELGNFIINDLILECTHKYHIPASSFCLELGGEQMTEMLEEIVFTKGMGVKICIDRFENSDEDNEIIAAVEPDYIKMSLDALNYDIYATSEDDYRTSALGIASYMLTTINKCHEKGIEVCICGVETKDQDAQLSKLFDYKQGYYYSKPERLEF